MPNNSDSLLYVLENMRKELESLCAEKMALGKRIAILKSTMMNLVRFSADETLIAQLDDILDMGERPRKVGLTQLCRSLLIQSQQPMTAHQVRDRLSDHVEHHQDALAAVTTILNRLVSYGEAQRCKTSPRDPYTWQWAQKSGVEPRWEQQSE